MLWTKPIDVSIGDSIIIDDCSWVYEKGKKPELFKHFSFMDDESLENKVRGEVGVVTSLPHCEMLHVEMSWETKLLEEWMIDVYIPRLGLDVVVLSSPRNGSTL